MPGPFMANDSSVRAKGQADRRRTSMAGSGEPVLSGPTQLGASVVVTEPVPAAITPPEPGCENAAVPTHILVTLLHVLEDCA